MTTSVPTPADYCALVEERLAPLGDPKRAVGSAAYLKSSMPLWGVGMPLLRKETRVLFNEPPWQFASRDEWERAVRTLWDEGTHREHRYAAIELCLHRRQRPWQTPEALPLYRHLVAAGAWWDLVDPVAAWLVGPILLQHNEVVAATMRQWAVDDDLWIRRAAIISQLSAKDATDVGLLADCIEANLEGSAFGSVFWTRKAIGWALRQHARIDPEWVRAFVAEHESALSGLSRREALKHLSST